MLRCIFDSLAPFTRTETRVGLTHWNTGLLKDRHSYTLPLCHVVLLHLIILTLLFLLVYFIIAVYCFRASCHCAGKRTIWLSTCNIQIKVICFIVRIYFVYSTVYSAHILVIHKYLKASFKVEYIILKGVPQGCVIASIYFIHFLGYINIFPLLAMTITLVDCH